MQPEPARTLTTSEARASLPTLVKHAASARRGKTLRANAVAIKPRGAAGVALLIPEADLAGAEQRIAELEALVEDLALIRVVEALTIASEGRPFVPAGELAAELGVAVA
ncbi:MAG: prevent-host-death family protein [Actinomycetota bacterium]|nr:prevent-host-death family protein [Actinomycetota bacterium]